MGFLFILFQFAVQIIFILAGVLTIFKPLRALKWPDPLKEKLLHVDNPVEAEVPTHWMPLSVMKRIMEMRVLTLSTKTTNVFMKFNKLKSKISPFQRLTSRPSGDESSSDSDEIIENSALDKQTTILKPIILNKKITSKMNYNIKSSTIENRDIKKNLKYSEKMKEQSKNVPSVSVSTIQSNAAESDLKTTLANSKSDSIASKSVSKKETVVESTVTVTTTLQADTTTLQAATTTLQAATTTLQAATTTLQAATTTLPAATTTLQAATTTLQAVTSPSESTLLPVTEHAKELSLESTTTHLEDSGDPFY